MTPSTILKMAAEVRALLAEGRQVCNLTVGDFDPTYFPIPTGLRDGIETALKFGQTVYPPPMGVPSLREAIQIYSRVGLGLEYPVEGVLVTSGARPAIYGAFRTLVDPGEGVIYSLPCWQYGNYCQLVGARPMPLSCDASTRFLPTRAMLEPMVRDARMLVLNSPNNPTGTMFEPDVLAGIADLVLEENARRGQRERPLYLLYDQVYWTLTYGETKHVTPVALRPALAPYTVSVDAISKAFAATGLRVGWALGPNDIIKAMGDYLADVGTWAPRPEQVATAMFLSASDAVAAYSRSIRSELKERLDALHDGLRAIGIECSRPAGAIYLSARFAIPGRTNEEIRATLLREADFAAVPFQGFGVAGDTGW
ncbi:MAG TPA: aminotransferase class I/II-fold pyridoxal phosphate-dependent enzyme, partial [Gemmatimonadaceae bacterium]|nr:aminotransferase class I/II-fold pyridoxal phosphate-dependent enzyme [Gemmatimonadaceae bacterium]